MDTGGFRIRENRKKLKLKNLTQRIYCDLEKSVAITFAEGGILCDMIRCDYYLRLGVK